MPSSDDDDNDFSNSDYLNKNQLSESKKKDEMNTKEDNSQLHNNINYVTGQTNNTITDPMYRLSQTENIHTSYTYSFPNVNLSTRTTIYNVFNEILYNYDKCSKSTQNIISGMTVTIFDLFITEGGIHTTLILYIIMFH